jgi:hypothetical protein
VKTLVGKGVWFGRLATVDLLFDGNEVRVCRDAAAAIAAVVRAKRLSSASICLRSVRTLRNS